MRTASIRNAVALILIIGHLAAFTLIFTRLHDYVAEASQKLELVLILWPVTGLIALAAIKHVMDHPGPSRAKSRAGLPFTAVALGMPLFFGGFIVYTLWTFPFGIADSVDSLRTTLAATEAALGTMMGAIAEKLFGTDPKTLRADD